MNSIYLVMEYFWNGAFWKDSSEKKDTPIRAFKSKEEAENFIYTMPVPVKKLQYEEQEGSFECEELEKKENGSWKRVGDEGNRGVLWEVEGAIRALLLRIKYNHYGPDQYYVAYYILEVPFGKEKEDGI